MKLTYIYFFLVLFTFFSCSNKKDESLTFDQLYPLPWRDPSNEEMALIGKAFVKNQIKVCSEYYVRPSSIEGSEYLVGCTPDGKTWSYFKVWPNFKEVMGPLLINLSQPRPGRKNSYFYIWQRHKN